MVRFHQAPPNYSSVVKWYNNRLITGHYKFDSCREDQTICARSIMENTLGYELSNGGSIPSERTTNNIKYNMFAKLNKSFNIDTVTISDEITAYGDGRIKYNEMRDIDLDPFYAVIPEVYRKFFIHKFMTITEDIPPHIDHDMITSINFYIKSNNGITKFHEIITENPEIYQDSVQIKGNGKNYVHKDVKLVNVFIAKDFEAYLLDVSKPHSVEFKSPRPIFRTAVVLQTPLFNYQQVYNMLKTTNNL